MTTATWNGVVIAESDDIVTVEGNAYFPRDAVREDVLRPSDHHTLCPWKGTASYYHLEVDGPGQPRRRLVLPDAQGRREGDQGPRRLLARRRGPLSGRQRAGRLPASSRAAAAASASSCCGDRSLKAS